MMTSNGSLAAAAARRAGSVSVEFMIDSVRIPATLRAWERNDEVALIVVDQNRPLPEQGFDLRLLGDDFFRFIHPGREMEGAALAQLAFRPDFAFHDLGDFPADGQAEARPPVFPGDRAVGLLKQLEDGVQLVVRNADARVADGRVQLQARIGLFFDVDGQLDLSILGELGRVAHEIEEDLPDPRGSLLMNPGTVSPMRQMISTGLLPRRGWVMLQTSKAVISRSKSMFWKVSWPASIFEKSRISLMSESSASPLLVMFRTNSTCSSLISVSRSMSANPMTEFIGVRISWLIRARNMPLAWLAATTCARSYVRYAHPPGLCLCPYLPLTTLGASIRPRSRKPRHSCAHCWLNSTICLFLTYRLHTQIACPPIGNTW